MLDVINSTDPPHICYSLSSVLLGFYYFDASVILKLAML